MTHTLIISLILQKQRLPTHLTSMAEGHQSWQCKSLGFTNKEPSNHPDDKPKNLGEHSLNRIFQKTSSHFLPAPPPQKNQNKQKNIYFCYLIRLFLFFLQQPEHLLSQYVHSAAALLVLINIYLFIGIHLQNKYS